MLHLKLIHILKFKHSNDYLKPSSVYKFIKTHIIILNSITPGDNLLMVSLIHKFVSHDRLKQTVAHEIINDVPGLFYVDYLEILLTNQKNGSQDRPL